LELKAVNDLKSLERRILSQEESKRQKVIEEIKKAGMNKWKAKFESYKSRLEEKKKKEINEVTSK
jgi:rRNA maturation endonuclease Nob1